MLYAHANIPEGLEVECLVICTVSSEPLLLADVMNTKISCAEPYLYDHLWPNKFGNSFWKIPSYGFHNIATTTV